MRSVVNKVVYGSDFSRSTSTSFYQSFHQCFLCNHTLYARCIIGPVENAAPKRMVLPNPKQNRKDMNVIVLVKKKILHRCQIRQKPALWNAVSEKTLRQLHIQEAITQ